MMKSVLKPVASSLRTVPFIKDVIAYHYDFWRVSKAVRGVYGSFESARRHLPRGHEGHERAANVSESEDVAGLTASRTLGALLPGDRPILEYLAKSLSGGMKVFNIGGNVGIEYYAYKSALPVVADVGWAICDVPSVVRRGIELAEARGESALSFTTDVMDGDGADVVLCVGTAHYLDLPLWDILAQFKSPPTHVVMAYVPATENLSFYTIQNIGYSWAPYRIFSLKETREAFALAGYDVVAEWHEPRRVTVPFHPTHAVENYHSMIFKRIG